MGRYAWVFFLIFIVWQIISSIAQSAAKKQQQTQMTEAVRKRREAAGGAAPSRTSASAGSGPVAPGPRGGRLDDLAARRKAQLRGTAATSLRGGVGNFSTVPALSHIAGKGGADPAPDAEADPSGASISPLPPPPRRREIQQMGADLRSAQGRPDVERAEREERSRLTREQEAVAQRRRDLAEEEISRRAAARRLSAATEAAEGAGTITTRARRERTARYRRLLASPHALQDLFVLREVLDPPLALRASE